MHTRTSLTRTWSRDDCSPSRCALDAKLLLHRLPVHRDRDHVVAWAHDRRAAAATTTPTTEAAGLNAKPSHEVRSAEASPASLWLAGDVEELNELLKRLRVRLTAFTAAASAASAAAEGTEQRA